MSTRPDLDVRPAHGATEPPLVDETAVVLRSSTLVLGIVASIAVAGCAAAGSGDPPSASLDASPTTTGPAATIPSTTDAPAAPAGSSSTTTSSTTSTTLAPATVAAELDLTADRLVLGTSIEGRPIVAERVGAPGGRRILVIGVIHANEDAGVAVVDRLREIATPDVPSGVELWLVESMNPDGEAAQDRHNADDVDLNRNFPYRWGPIGAPGDSQYAGTGPASEPETRAIVEFVSRLRPDLALWYHQDANLVIPGTGRDGDVRARYAELTGLPLAECCGGGGVYTGIAATWARAEAVAPDGIAFIVELPGGDLTPAQVEDHATAVLTVAGEL